MARNERETGDKQTDNEKKKHTRQQGPQPTLEKLHAWDQGQLSSTEPPFYPKMDEHAAILSKIPFSEQRHEFVMRLHQTHGNRYVQRLVQSMKVQANLTISDPNDVYEQEADGVAKAVIETLNSPVQRQEEEEKPAQMKISREKGQEEEELQTLRDESTSDEVSVDMESRINSTKGSGHPLSGAIRGPMEQAFGADFSGVRVHTDSEADALNRQLSAKAFTTGPDIFFKRGAFDPNSKSGQQLIAHELSHVLQQLQGEVKPGIKANGTASNNDQVLKKKADQGAKESMKGKTRSVDSPGTGLRSPWQGLRAPLVQRLKADEKKQFLDATDARIAGLPLTPIQKLELKQKALACAEEPLYKEAMDKFDKAVMILSAFRFIDAGLQACDNGAELSAVAGTAQGKRVVDALTNLRVEDCPKPEDAEYTRTHGRRHLAQAHYLQKNATAIGNAITQILNASADEEKNSALMLLDRRMRKYLTKKEFWGGDEDRGELVAGALTPITFLTDCLPLLYGYVSEMKTEKEIKHYMINTMYNMDAKGYGRLRLTLRDKPPSHWARVEEQSKKYAEEKEVKVPEGWERDEATKRFPPSGILNLDNLTDFDILGDQMNRIMSNPQGVIIRTTLGSRPKDRPYPVQRYRLGEGNIQEGGIRITEVT
jgi:hypothetical protein